jgi:tRNA-splicing ligase RtcB
VFVFFILGIIMSETWQGKLEKIDSFRWRIPTSYKPGMEVPGIIYASETLLKDIIKDKALEQVSNVAFLPGVVNILSQCRIFTGDMVFQ